MIKNQSKAKTLSLLSLQVQSSLADWTEFAALTPKPTIQDIGAKAPTGSRPLLKSKLSTSGTELAVASTTALNGCPNARYCSFAIGPVQARSLTASTGARLKRYRSPK